MCLKNRKDVNTTCLLRPKPILRCQICCGARHTVPHRCWEIKFQPEGMVATREQNVSRETSREVLWTDVGDSFRVQNGF